MMKATARPLLSDQIVVVHSDYPEMMKLTVALGEMRYRVTSSHATRALRRTLQLAKLRPRALVIALDGTETVTDVRELVATVAPSPALLLSPRMPPRPAMARVVNEHGGAILALGESAVVVVSTLVSLVAQHSSVER